MFSRSRGRSRASCPRRTRRSRKSRSRPALAGGETFSLRANVELPAEVRSLARFGAEGIGLFRSEFLYLTSSDGPPPIADQERVYAGMIEACRPHPVVVRTYDLGGEKG